MMAKAGTTTPEQRERIRALRNPPHSLSVREIARLVGVTPTTAHYHCDDIPEPEGGWRYGHRKVVDHARALELHKQGLSYAQIAKELNCARGSAWRAVNPGEQHGETSRRPAGRQEQASGARPPARSDRPHRDAAE